MEQNNKPVEGTWNSMRSEPRITWAEVDETHTVVFLKDNPEEIVKANDETYYIFDVEESMKRKVIETSAWSLLKELKRHMPLCGKRLAITKRADSSGKKRFEVLDLKALCTKEPGEGVVAE
jgi:hypothetical protein